MGHILFFALLTYQLQAIPRFRNFSYLRQGVLALATALILGLGIELIQSGIQRTLDGEDLLKNGLGALVGAAFLLSARRRITGKTLAGFQILVGILTALGIYPLLTAGVDEYRAWRQFPILADFETCWELERWTGGAQFDISDEVSFQGQRALRVDLNTETYSGVALSYFPQNWSGYSRLRMEVYNPAEDPLVLTCRIHDARHTRGPQDYHDRFNRRFTILKGWNTMTIELAQVAQAPRARTLDLSRIRGLGLFSVRLSQPRTVYLDGVRLLP
ncbi:MAG: hypothetical protein WBG37_03920 [Desulfobacterales bacterium]